MEKEIRMPYKEFLEMKELIEKQAECIEQLKENPFNTFIDSRYSPAMFRWGHFDVLKVIGENEITNVLKENLDQANIDLHNMTNRMFNLEREVRSLEIKAKKRWWSIKK